MLVCQFGSPLRSAPNSQTSNLYCHPSLGDSVGASPPETPERPRAQMAGAPGSRTYKDKRSRDCVRLRLPQTLAGLNPSGSPRGGIIARETAVPARASVPRIRAHNIIPSELCNSRRHRQYPAPAESNINGSEARRNGLQGV